MTSSPFAATTSASRPADPETSRLQRIALGVALLAFVVHVGLFAGGVWSFEPLNYDDPQVLEIASDRSVVELVREPHWYAYKPVYFVSLKFDTFFGAGASGVAHVHNLLLHALAAGLLVLLLHALLGNLWVAGAAGALFAVHPVHVESIAWISGRKDVLSLVWVLLAHLVYRRARERGRVSWGAPLLLALGGLTKGTVWLWAGILALDEVLYVLAANRENPQPGRWRGAILRWLPCLVVSLLGVVLDAWMARSYGPGAVEHGVSTPALAAAMAGVHFGYVAHELVPVGLSIDYAVDPAGSWGVPLPWVGLLLALGAVGLLVVSLSRRWVAGTLAAGLWLFGLLPVNNIWPRTAILMADRYLYMPALGLYVLLAALLVRQRTGRAAVLAIAAVLLSLLAIQRTTVFADSQKVWADATSKVPGSALAWIQRGQAAAARRAWDGAVDFATRAVDLEPRPEILVKARLLRTGALLGQLGELEKRGKRASDADFEAVLDEANRAATLAAGLGNLVLVREDPREVRAEAEVLRGKVLERLRDPASAMDAYARAVNLWDDHAVAHYNLATLLATTGTAEDLEQAETHLLKALDRDRDFLDASLQLASVRALRNLPDEALKILRRAEERHGRTPDVLFAMAQVHLTTPRGVIEAEKLLQELKRQAPGHPKASRLLSDIHLAQGRILLQSGRLARDRKKLRAALERYDDASHRVIRRWKAEVGAGDTLLELGRYREARGRYRKALDWSDRVRWIQRLVARAGVLEAAWLARYGESDTEWREAARLMAAAMAPPTQHIDLGLLPLDDELGILRLAAARLKGPEPAAAHAAEVLRAAALAVTGDEEGALSLLGGVLADLPPETEETDTHHAALLLRGVLRERSGLAEEAQRDYELVRDRRTGDPVPRLRLLRLRLRKANIRLDLAKTMPEHAGELQQAVREVDDVARDLLVFADENTDLLSAGLLATDGEMHRQRWVEAVIRLNRLKGRFPRETAVYRGLAQVYVNHYLVTRTPTLVKEAARQLSMALALDPRDPLISLDAAHVAQIAGDLQRAVRHARRARSLELVPDGPAAQRLVAYHLRFGRAALERGEVKTAFEEAERAQQVQPSSAAPWVLRGEIYMLGQKYDEALSALRTAKELDPGSEEADEALAEVHRKRAFLLQVDAVGLQVPPHPRKNAAAWAAMDAEERDRVSREWTKVATAVEEQRARKRRDELRELDAALRYAPTGTHAERILRRIQDIRGSSPEARKVAFDQANVEYERGMALYQDGKLVSARRAFERAVEFYPDHGRAHYYTARVIHDLLLVPGDGSAEQRRLEERLINRAYDALHALQKLDPLSRFPERHRLRGMLGELIYLRNGANEMRRAALGAYERYLHAMEKAGRGGEKTIGEVRAKLPGLRIK